MTTAGRSVDAEAPFGRGLSPMLEDAGPGDQGQRTASAINLARAEGRHDSAGALRGPEGAQVPVNRADRCRRPETSAG